MLNDSFAEQAVKAKADREFYLRMLFNFILLIMALYIFGVLNPMLGIMIFIIDIWVFCYFVGYHKKEYEYSFTNGNVEIAAIYKQLKRRELMHFDMDQVLMIVPDKSERIANEQIVKKRDYTSRKKGIQKVALLVEIHKHKELVLIEPNERVLTHLKLVGKHKCYDI